MEIIKEIKTQIFDTSKIKVGDAVFITDNKFDGNENCNVSYGGTWLVNEVSDSTLKLIDHEGHIDYFEIEDFVTNNPLDNVPNYEIEILKSK